MKRGPKPRRQAAPPPVVSGPSVLVLNEKHGNRYFFVKDDAELFAHVEAIVRARDASGDYYDEGELNAWLREGLASLGGRDAWDWFRSRASAEYEGFELSELGWKAFEEEYREQIGRMAGAIFRRWRAPSAVAVEDLEQELWLHAWRAWGAWRPDRGSMSQAAFTVWTARHEAQRWLQVQRNTPRRSGREDARWETPMSFTGDDGNVTLNLLAVDPGQEAAAAFTQAVRRGLAACVTPLDRTAQRAMRCVFDAGFVREHNASALVRGAWRRLEECR